MQTEYNLQIHIQQLNHTTSTYNLEVHPGKSEVMVLRQTLCQIEDDK
jgi:hypothetical protein